MNKKRRMSNPYFVQAVDTVRSMSAHTTDPLEKLRIIDYAMYVVKMEYVMYTKTRILYEAFPNPIQLLFPGEYYSVEGALRRLGSHACTCEMEITDDTAVCAGDYYSLADKISSIRRNGFIRTSNHMAYYYTDIDLLTVYNGNHSVSAGQFFKQGSVETKIFDVSLLFDVVDTDGVFWFDASTGKKLCRVADYRIAILYECAKMKNKKFLDLDSGTAKLYKGMTGIFSRVINRFTIVGGAVGVGKSSFISVLSNMQSHKSELIYEYIKRPKPLSDYFEGHFDIIEESTLGTNTFNHLMESKKHGYSVELFYIGTSNIDECLKRAEKNYVSHSVYQNEKYRRLIFEERFERLFRFLPYCDKALFFDNDNGFSKVAEYIERDIFITCTNAPTWLFEMCKLFEERKILD